LDGAAHRVADPDGLLLLSGQASPELLDGVRGLPAALIPGRRGSTDGLAGTARAAALRAAVVIATGGRSQREEGANQEQEDDAALHDSSSGCVWPILGTKIPWGTRQASRKRPAHLV